MQPAATSEQRSCTTDADDADGVAVIDLVNEMRAPSVLISPVGGT